MRTLRMQDCGSEEGHGGEVFACVYSSDGAFVLSGGWDGCLRLWMPGSAHSVTRLEAAIKPLSACAFSRDGTALVSGSMDGELRWWDAVSHQRKRSFFAHIRPISAIQFSPDGLQFATASWDRKLLLHSVSDQQANRPLIGHQDIVSGCRWSADSQQLLSWSHDGTLRLWDVENACEIARLADHADRVTAACLSADGHWAISGCRDGRVKLWDLRRHVEIRSIRMEGEVRGCWFLDNGNSVLTVSAEGWIALWSLPGLEAQGELASCVRPLCGDLSPSGKELVLGSQTGRLHFITLEIPALEVTATPRFKPKSGVITRFLGKQKVERSYQYACPSCGHVQESASIPCDAVPCSQCRRLLRVSLEVPQIVVSSQ